jgi:hypothetical protein
MTYNECNLAAVKNLEPGLLSEIVKDVSKHFETL